MYNGIGLLTPRGSGTSGYVQGNKFNLRGPPQVRTEPPKDGGPKQKKPNQDILDHKKKREIEVKVEQERERLEQEGVHNEAEIEELLALFREQELAKLAASVQNASKLVDETHAIAERKIEQMSKLKAALGVKGDIREGDAFNRELQEQLKAQRMAEREVAQKAREEEAKRRAKEAKRREKERAKEAKRREKEAIRLEKERIQREAERREREAQRMEEASRRLPSPAPRMYRKNEPAPDRYDPYADEKRYGFEQGRGRALAMRERDYEREYDPRDRGRSLRFRDDGMVPPPQRLGRHEEDWARGASRHKERHAVGEPPERPRDREGLEAGLAAADHRGGAGKPGRPVRRRRSPSPSSSSSSDSSSSGSDSDSESGSGSSSSSGSGSESDSDSATTSSLSGSQDRRARKGKRSDRPPVTQEPEPKRHRMQDVPPSRDMPPPPPRAPAGNEPNGEQSRGGIQRDTSRDRDELRGDQKHPGRQGRNGQGGGTEEAMKPRRRHDSDSDGEGKAGGRNVRQRLEEGDYTFRNGASRGDRAIEVNDHQRQEQPQREREDRERARRELPPPPLLPQQQAKDRYRREDERGADVADQDRDRQREPRVQGDRGESERDRADGGGERDRDRADGGGERGRCADRDADGYRPRSTAAAPLADRTGRFRDGPVSEPRRARGDEGGSWREERSIRTERGVERGGEEPLRREARGGLKEDRKADEGNGERRRPEGGSPHGGVRRSRSRGASSRSPVRGRSGRDEGGRRRRSPSPTSSSSSGSSSSRSRSSNSSSGSGSSSDSGSSGITTSGSR